MVQIEVAVKHGLVSIELIHHRILGFYISRQTQEYVSCRIISENFEVYRKHIVYSNGGSWLS
jgi:hypothetical protein